MAKKIHELEMQTNSQFLEIYEALENLINDTAYLKQQKKSKENWDKREKVGFKTKK